MADDNLATQEVGRTLNKEENKEPVVQNPTMTDDRSGLLTSMEMAEKKKSNSVKSLYFEDGIRQIDHMLAYEIVAGDDEKEAAKKEEYRQTYLKNLQSKGLEIEHAEISSGDQVYSC